MPYPLNLPSGRPEEVPQEYIPHLLSAIEGFLQQPDLWQPGDYAQGRQQMEQLKVYIINCFGKCIDAMALPGISYIDPFAAELTGGAAISRTALSNMLNGFIVGVTPAAQFNALSWKFNARAGVYTLNFLTLTASQYCRLWPYVDGVEEGTYKELYTASAVYNVFAEITVHVLTDGDHTLTLSAKTKHASSSAYNFFISDLWLVRTGDL